MKKKSGEISRKLCGRDGFEAWYGEVFGGRWQNLRSALLKEPRATEYRVPGAQKSYFLDSASILAALCLPLEGADSILDLCAAPGGKTLVLASRMDDDAHLYSNERSPARKCRLSAVVSECLPQEISGRVTVSCSDGAAWCRNHGECFDRILLDAPCSSERHVFNDEKYLSQWSPSRIKSVAMEEWALLSSAYRMLAPGGIMVYSTCALAPEENDGIVRRLVRKFGGREKSDDFSDRAGKSGPAAMSAPVFLSPEPEAAEIAGFVPEDFALPAYQSTEFGYQVLPDVADGAGPIYFSVIQKQKSD